MADMGVVPPPMGPELVARRRRARPRRRVPGRRRQACRPAAAQWPQWATPSWRCSPATACSSSARRRARCTSEPSPWSSACQRAWHVLAAGRELVTPVAPWWIDRMRGSDGNGFRGFWEAMVRPGDQRRPDAPDRVPVRERGVMITRAGVLLEQPGKWEVVELELEPPGQDELLIRMVAAGLCHSDDHIATGDLPLPPVPWRWRAVTRGPASSRSRAHTPGWAVGDHVVLSFLSVCGTCRWCASGLQNLCDNGAPRAVRRPSRWQPAHAPGWCARRPGGRRVDLQPVVHRLYSVGCQVRG